MHNAGRNRRAKSRRERTEISRKQLIAQAAQISPLVEPLEKRQLLTGTWTALTHTAPSGIEAMVLLSNGDVMGQIYGDNEWALLTPSSTGSYINGTWSRLSNDADSRTYYSTQTLENGSVFIAGGEYGTGGATGAVYNPLTNTWTPIPDTVGSYIDADSEILANGDVLEAPVYPAGTGETYLYNPTSNTWSTGPQLYRGSDADEQNWVKLADGSILAPDGEYTSERYVPSLNQWVNDATDSIAQTDSEGEFGTGVLLPDGKALYVGTGNTTEIYTPAYYNSTTGIYSPNGTSAKGSWSAGPTLPSGLGQDDAPEAVLPDGNVLFTVGPADSYNGPTSFYIYNYATNTVALSSGAPTETDPPYVNRFLDLPDGSVLMSVDGSTLYDYNDNGTAISSAAPTITSISLNASTGVYTLTGTQLNGDSEGAYYGDDAQMYSNYPIVRLNNSGGTYFARTFNWSSDSVDTGTTPITTNFALPLNLPAGTYTVNVMVNGLISASSTITTPAVTDVAPTITTAAAATPSPVTGTTTTLSVTANSSTGEALTYTWVNTSAPSGDSTASFSVNGTANSSSTTVTFQQAGTYKFAVTVTDAAGLSVTSSVSVVVGQTLSSVGISPAAPNLTSGQTDQLTATGYDQFGNAMSSQPTFNWNVSGGGTVSSAGLYTTPATGALATVTATTGSLSASDSMYVVSSPWISTDIGSPGVAGTAFNSGGTFNVSGSGSDVWSTSDQFHYVYQTMSGNGFISLEVAAEPNPLTTWEKAGVMIRQSTSDNSQQAFMAITPGNGAAFQYRNVSGGTSYNDNTDGPTAPYYVKLVRSGNTLSGYYSANGTTWTLEASTTIVMTGTVDIGMFIVSQSNTAASTAIFQNVNMLLAQPVSETVSAGVPTSFNVLTGDTGPAGATLTLTGLTNPTKGTVSFNSTGGVTYNAASGVSGLDTITYTVSDGQGDSATGIITINILGLQAYYHFNEDTGTTSADATGDGYTATLSGATWGSGVDGTSGIVLSGSGEYATTPALNLDTATVTLSGWFDAGSSEVSDAGLIFERDSNGGNGLDYYNTTTLGFTWGANAATYNWNTGLSPTAGTWTFIALVVTPTDATIYMEPFGGAMTSAEKTFTNAVQQLPDGFGIGEDSGYTTRDYAGSIDEVRIYNTNLSAGAVAALANLYPTVATAAAASATTVTGTGTTLSVTGGDYLSTNTLTYTWAATNIPSGATTPTFTVNGTNASNNTTVTFHKAGNYTFTVTISDPDNLTTTSSVSVAVNQSATSIAVTPASVSLAAHASQTFSAVEDDQFAIAMATQPTFVWSSTGSGSINASTGVYTAGYATAAATVTATAGSITQNASVTVTDTAPAITTTTESPSPVTGTTASLSVAASGSSALTYTWATVGTPPAAVSFSANSNSSASASTATFSKAGNYTLQVTVTDQGGLSNTSSVSFTVNQTLTTAAISPATANLNENQTEAFTAIAYDQFGNALSTQPTFTWAKTAGIGSINAGTGVYTSPGSAGTAGITATTGSIVASASVAVTDSPPVVTSAASASPSSVTGTSVGLSVAGSSDVGSQNLIYTWSATNVTGGAASPTFSVNATNAAQNTTATFSSAGAYTFTVTLSDGQGGTATSSVNVTVSQTLTSIVITPATTSLNENQSQAFTAVANDQFGIAMTTQPTFTWAKTAGIGSINASSGVYTSPASAGTATITATGSSVVGTANITVTDSAPTVATPASASPSPVTGNSTALSVLGASDVGASSLTYTWAATTIPAGASSPVFTINGTNAAQNTTATFSKAGAYTFTATIADGQGGVVTSSVNVTVNQTLSSIVLSPSHPTVVENATEAFSAIGEDQFNIAMVTQPTFTWSKTAGIGSINASTGVYTAPGSTGTATIVATSGGFSRSTSIIVNDSAPTVATPASASPSTVTANTTALSVLGASDGGESNLTYTWATTTLPSGATAPTFTVNGTNAAKNTTATFTQAGNYTLRVTLSDNLGLTTTSSVNVTVSQTLTSITVTPPAASVNENASQAFSATGYDQFGNALSTQPVFNWTLASGIGSINAGTGVYTAPATAGSAAINATAASVTGSASVSVVNQGPSVANAASASPSTVTATTTALSVLGSDPQGESSITYTWADTTLPSGATAPTFSINGTNAAKNTTATFSKAGSYTFTVTLTDSQSASTTSTVNVTVSQTLSAIALSNTSVVPGNTSQATALDQFANALSISPTWSATGGSITTAGLFTASSTAGLFTVSANQSGTVVNTAITIVPTTFNGSTGSDTYAIRLSPTNPAMEQIFVSTPETGSPTYSVALTQLSALNFTPASDGSVTVDFSNGNPLPTHGINYSGGSSLFIEGVSTGQMGFAINASQIVDNADASSPISYSGIQSVEFDLAGGSNLLTQSAQPAAAVTFNAGPGNNTLNVSGGSFTFNTDPALSSGSLTVNDNAAVVFSPPAAGIGYTPRNLAALNIGSTATAKVDASTTATDRTVLETSELSISPGGTLDLGNNAMIVHNGNLPAISSLIGTGYSGGTWTGKGITSSTAAGDTTYLTALGVTLNNINGSAIDTSFDGQHVLANDVLIKYTYYGDTNLDGQVDGSDYSRIDDGYLFQLTGWFNGDFNYDNAINGSDYTLIDNAFNVQGSQLPSAPSAPASVNPLAYYKFTDGVGATVAADASGNGFNGIIHNATVTTGVDASTALAFNGTSSDVTLPALNLSSNTVTLSGWIDSTGTQTDGAGLIFNPAATAGNGLMIGSDNQLAYSWGTSGATYNFNSHLIVPENQWTFVALVVSAKSATLYMQPQGGQIESVTNSIANPAQPFNTATDIGADISSTGSKFFKGAMDEVRIYNSSLDAAQILTLADLAPTVTVPAASNPSPTVAIQTNLTVLGGSTVGPSDLTYTWAATEAPADSRVTFSDNGTSSAYNTIATGTVPGKYIFTVTIANAAHLSVTSSVSEVFDAYPYDIAEINQPPSPKGAGIVPWNLGNFVVNSVTPTDFNFNDNPDDHWVLIFNSLTIVLPYSQIDLGDSDMIIHNTSVTQAQQTLATVTGYVNAGYGEGGAANWTYPGLISSLAAQKGLGRSAITVMLNMNAQGKPIYTTFDGQPVTATDVLVKYNG